MLNVGILDFDVQTIKYENKQKQENKRPGNYRAPVTFKITLFSTIITEM